MYITFSDGIGMTEVKVDMYGVSFIDGFALFSCEDEQYKVPLSDLICMDEHSVNDDHDGVYKYLMEQEFYR